VTVTVLLCGVGADTGNVEPVPAVDAAGRFEYVPIPEKGPAPGAPTYGELPQRFGEGTLADLVDRVRPNSTGSWIADPDAVRARPVHRDPNFAALTYGEHRPGYVQGLIDLDPGDVVAFYTGLRAPDTGEKHRYVIGHFELASPVVVLPPDRPRRQVGEALADHPDNAHARRFAGNGALYYHDPAFEGRTKPVAIASGREPGGLCDRAVRLTDRREGSGYYMAPAVEDALSPRQGGGEATYLGGIKPAVPCAVAPDAFRGFLTDRVDDGHKI
jgi:hypothetical protein